MMGIGDPLLACVQHFGRKRHAQSSIRPTPRVKVLLFDPIVDGAVTDPQLGGHVSHRHLPRREARFRGRNPVDVAEPPDGLRIEGPSLPRLQALHIQFRRDLIGGTIRESLDQLCSPI